MAKVAKRKRLDPESIRLCDCCVCGAVLYGESEVDRLTAYHPDALAYALGHPVAGYVALRVQGRPYCRPCSLPRVVPQSPATADDTSPWRQNAVRALEGD